MSFLIFVENIVHNNIDLSLISKITPIIEGLQATVNYEVNCNDIFALIKERKYPPLYN